MALRVSRLALVATLVASTVAAQVRWQSLAPGTAPPARGGHGFVVAGPLGNLLFGGQDGGTYRSDTWTWDGSSWTQLSPGGAPTGRAHFAIAYDPLRNRVVLFSGWDGNRYPPDTWEYDGTTWTQVQTAVAPPGRDWAGMEFDPVSGRIVLFGGHDWQRSTAGQPNYADTWAYDASGWTQLQPANSPSHRWGHAMVRHDALGGVVLHGGTAGNDTWLWTGADWLQIPTPNAPPARTRPGIAYDPSRQRAVLWGGVSAGVIRTDVWELAGTDWVQRSPTGNTPPVSDTAGIFDFVRQEVVNFGGALVPDRSSTSSATDAYGPVAPATSRSFGSGCPGSVGTPSMDPSRPAWVGGRYEVVARVGAPNVSTFWLVGFSNQRTGTGLGLPFPLDAVGMPGCTLLVDPAAIASAMSRPGGETPFSLAVPNLPSLIGGAIYSQAMAIDQGANPLGLVASNATEHVIGGL